MLAVFLTAIYSTKAQVKISTPADLITTPLPDNSAMLEIKSIGKGVLIPRMATTDRDAIALPATGLLIFNTTIDQFEYYGATPAPGWYGIARNGSAGGWSLTGNNGTSSTTNFLGTLDNQSLAFRTFNQPRVLIDSIGRIGFGTINPNSILNISGNNTPGFAFGASQFFVGGYSRPTRFNTAASNISYGFLSHTQSDNVGTYNAVAGGVLRTADTSMANLTGAIAHVNNGGTFQTALLGIVNSRADQANDAFRYSAAWLRTPNPAALNATQLANTYMIFAPDTTKNYFGGSMGIGTSAPNASLNILGNNLSGTGFAFGASQFFIGAYSRPTRLNVAATEISYGLLSHTNSNGTGTYNAVAGRVLRNADTTLVDLTAALGHVNRSGTNNFQTAVLGIVNSRADQFDDAQVFSAGRFSDMAGVITAAQDSNTYSIFSNSARKSYFAGSIGVGTTAPNSIVNILGNNTAGFPFGASQFFVGAYSRPTRLNTAASNISYGLLSHSNADNVGTYNAVAGRILRTGDTSMANLTAALGHVNNGGNFQTAVLGTVNSRLNESTDAQVFSAGRFTDAAGVLTATQEANTYSIFSSSTRKSFFAGNVGIGTSNPTNKLHVAGALDPLRLEGLQTGLATDSLITTDGTGVLKKIAPSALGLANAWSINGNAGTTASTNFLGTTDNQSLAISTFSQTRILVDSIGRTGFGTTNPNSILNISGNNTPGFAFGASQFFVGGYSRPTRFNTAASNISYGFLSHTQADNVGTYNAVAGRVLRTADTSLANLTGALAHVNNGGTFETGLLGIVNSRADQPNDAFRYSAAWLRTPNPAALNATQLANTYMIFAPDTTKNYFGGSIGIGTSAPNASLNILGNNLSGTGFAFGASQFFIGAYSRPTRLNVAATEISYGVLSHSQTNTTGTYNAVAGRILRNADTSMANLTAALGHVNNGGNFQTAVLGTVNSRADEASDLQVFSAGRFTDAAGVLTANQEANTYSIFSSSTRKSFFAGNVGIGTSTPNSSLNISGNTTAGFAFGANQFFIGGYSRPTRLNTAASEISYGFLSHTNSNTTGTYNAVAGRVLRNADTSMANLTAALGHVNNGGNFQTALLGTVNSRADQASDAQNFAAARLTVPAITTLTAGNLPNTYTVFAPDSVKSFFKGAVGINTNAPSTSLDVDGGLTVRAAAVVDLSVSATVTVGNRSYVRVSNGGAQAITLSNGLQVGQILILENTNTGTPTLSDAANVNVVGAGYTFNSADDTISLVWNGTKWVETSRADN